MLESLEGKSAVYYIEIKKIRRSMINEGLFLENIVVYLKMF